MVSSDEVLYTLTASVLLRSPPVAAVLVTRYRLVKATPSSKRFCRFHCCFSTTEDLQGMRSIQRRQLGQHLSHTTVQYAYTSQLVSCGYIHIILN